MKVKSGAPGQPHLDLGMLVRAVIVDDQMNVEVVWHIVLDSLPQRERRYQQRERRPNPS